VSEKPAKRSAIPAILAALTLAGCDASVDELGATAQASIAQQCQQVANEMGFAATRVQAVCECTVNRLVPDAGTSLAAVNQDTIERALSDCAEEGGAAGDAMETF
jgi:uncharacterized protein YaaN involved in tellurite resistance